MTTPYITNLVAELVEDRRLYYAGAPRCTDEEFDAKERNLKKDDPANAYFKTVGTPVTNSRAMVKHPVLMGSLSNAFNEDEIGSWFARVTKLSEDKPPKALVTTPKLDGLSAQLVYTGGRLKQAALRNTGTEGEDVTANIRNSGVERLLSDPWDVAIRGEVVVHKKTFAKYLAGDYANERAAAAGILRGGSQEHVDKLRFYAFGATPIGDVDCGNTFSSLSFTLEWLAEQKIRTPAWTVIGFDEAAVIAEWQRHLAERDNFPYLMDGMVVAVNNRFRFDRLGVVDSCPRGALACKWRGQQVAKATITGLNNSVGRTGKITPVATITPTSCGGVTISNISLMNWDEIRRLDAEVPPDCEGSGLGLGSEVQIERAGDVIPRLTKLLKLSNVRFERPETCPVCSTPTEERGPFQVCQNPECSAQTFRKILHWLKSRNILYLGEETVDRLMFLNGPLNTIDDLYTLSRSHLIDATRSEKTADKILDELEKSKDCTPAEMIGSIGMPGIGPGEAAKVVKAMKITSYRTLMDAWECPNSITKALGPVTGQKFCNGVLKYRDLLKNLWKILRVSTDSPDEAPVGATAEWSGKLFCITGSGSIQRPMLIKVITDAGGVWKSSVVNNLDYLIVADSDMDGVKAKAAREKKIKTITEEQALEWAGYK